MKVIALSCPQCGGSQEVSGNQRTLECRYCGVTLCVERTPNGELERLLVEAQAETSALLVENRILEITNTIHRLDHAWEEQRKELLIQGKNGTHEPSSTTGMLMLVGGCVAVLGSIWYALSTRGSGGFFVGLLGAGFAFGGYVEYQGGKIFEELQAKHLRKRIELHRQLGNLTAARKRKTAVAR